MSNRNRLIFPRVPSAKNSDPELRFEFECPRTWDSLAPTNDASIRHCNDCEKPVHLSRDAKEAQAHAQLISIAGFRLSFHVLDMTDAEYEEAFSEQL